MNRIGGEGGLLLHVGVEVFLAFFPASGAGLFARLVGVFLGRGSGAVEDEDDAVSRLEKMTGELGHGAKVVSFSATAFLESLEFVAKCFVVFPDRRVDFVVDK